MIKNLQIDEEDRPLLSVRTWCVDKSTGYVRNSTWQGAPIYLHRLIAGAQKGEIVDHINGDKLDLRRANLRIVSHATNIQNRTKLSRNNTSGVRGVGVYRDRSRYQWQAYATVDGKRKALGYFSDLLIAAALTATWRAFYMPGAAR